MRWAALAVMVLLGTTIVMALLPDSRQQIRRASASTLGEGIASITQGVVQVLGDLRTPDSRVPRGLRRYDPANDAWVEVDDPGVSRAVLLVHGLDEPGGIWDQLAPALAADGHAVLRFDYANDQAIAMSADELGFALRRLNALGVRELDLVCHSMGGLVARDALTRADVVTPSDQIPRVGTLITLGTPHGGSPWARLRSVAEAREQVQRWAQSDDLDPSRLLGFFDDGTGQAGIDLLPGSAFLNDLNARAMPRGVRVVCVVGRTDEPSNAAASVGSAVARSTLADLLGEHDASVVLGEVERLGRELGDGVVPVSSAAMDGADEVIEVRANHRAMIRTIELEESIRRQGGLELASEPPGIAIVVDRLHRQ